MTCTLQKLIHFGCRDLQLSVCGKVSMSDMTEADLTAVLNRLKSDGFKVDLTGRKSPPKRHWPIFGWSMFSDASWVVRRVAIP